MVINSSYVWSLLILFKCDTKLEDKNGLFQILYSQIKYDIMLWGKLKRGKIDFYDKKNYEDYGN